MTDNTQGAAPPKKRSFFKRAAWQDAAKKEEDDIFSHANEFTDIVAEQNKREEEKRKKAESEKKRKRRRVSSEHDAPALPGSASGSSPRASRTGGKARSRTPLSPVPSASLSNSLASRYNSLAKSVVRQDASLQRSVVVDLVDSDDDLDDNDDSGYNSKSFNDGTNLDPISLDDDDKHDMAFRPSQPVPIYDDDTDDDMDPVLAALAAKARQRAQAAATTTQDGELSKAPIAQLYIEPMMDNAKPLMVKVRIDATLEKPRLAWCQKQGFTPDLGVFFTWRGQRVYDSTTVRRLGIVVDAKGYASVDGDSNILDENALPKVAVEAWTEELFKENKKKEAEEAAAKKRAAEELLVEKREPTPEPAPKVKKYRLILKARGRADFKIQVNPDTDFGHLANAYKQGLKIDKSQAITLMFDGDRLSPLERIADTDIEDMDSIDVNFK